MHIFLSCKAFPDPPASPVPVAMDCDPVEVPPVPKMRVEVPAAPKKQAPPSVPDVVAHASGAPKAKRARLILGVSPSFEVCLFSICDIQTLLHFCDYPGTQSKQSQNPICHRIR